MPGSDGLENLIRFMLAETKEIIFSGYELISPRIESLRGRVLMSSFLKMLRLMKSG